MSKLIYHPSKPYSLDLNDMIEVQDFIQKGKALPVGTVRNWSGTSYVKEADGWKPVAHQKHEKTVEQVKPSKPAQPEESNTEHNRPIYEGHQKIKSVKVLPFASFKDAKEYHDKLSSEVIDHKDFSSWDKVPETSLKLSELSTTQDQVNKPDGRQSDSSILVVKKDGKHIILNGNHRVEQAGQDGKSNIRVRIFDLDGGDSKISEPEKSALKEYQSGVYNSALGGYANLQSYLRSGEPKFGKYTPEESKLADQVISNVSSAIKKHPLDKPMTVYRGLKVNKNEPGSEVYASLKEGDTFSDKGFTSTTTSKTVQDKFTEKLNRSDTPVSIEISLKAGDPALPMDQYHKSTEKEILLDRGTKFKVVSVQDGKNGRKIKMELA